MSRAAERAGMPDKVRLTLVENDVDELKAHFNRVEERLSKILWAVMAVLTSVTTSAVLLAINLGVK